MNYKAKAAAFSLVAATMAVSTLPIYAEGEDSNTVTKNESVYTVLNGDGSVKEITVSDSLHSDSGFANYKDKSELKDVENLKSTENVKTEGNALVWNTKDTDIYYQGTSEKELPLAVNITYYLDGKKVTSEELLGKSGHVKIQVEIDNKSERTYSVNGKQYHLVTPFVTVAGAMMDMDVFKNVTISHGTVESDSSHNIVGGVMIPGLRKGLEEVIDSDTLNTLSDYIIDDIEIEADVTDYVSPNIMIASSTNLDALQNEMKDAKLDNVFDDLDSLKSATQQLIDGSQQLYDGAVKLNDGVGSAQDGVAKLLAGAAKLSDGAAKLSAGADKLNGGAGQLESGLATLTSNNGALNQGAQDLSTGIFQLVNTVLDSKNLPAVTPENYADVFAGQFNVTDEQLNVVKQQILDGINATRSADQQMSMDSPEFQKVLYYAATTGDNSFTAENLQAAGAALTQAQTAGAQVTDASAKAANGSADPKTNEMVQAVKVGLAANITSDQLQEAYTTVMSNAALFAQDPNLQAALAQLPHDETTVGHFMDYVIAHHAEDLISFMGAQSLGDPAVIQQIMATLSNDLTEAVQSYTQAVMRQQTFMADGFNDANVQSGLKQIVSTKIMTTPDEDVLNGILQQVEAGGVDEKTARLVVAYAANYGGVTDYSETSPTAVISSSAVALTNLQKLQAAIEANYNTAETNNLIKSILTDTFVGAVKENEDLKSIKKLLDGALTLKSGIKAYTDGASAALNGAQQLSNGAKELSDGAKTLSNGTNELKDGISTLSGGLETLKSGSTALADGAKTLMEGIQKYNDEGISKLTDSPKITSAKEASDLLDVVVDEGNTYDNYSGISEGTDGSIKFVYKVEGAKKAKTTKTEKKTEEKMSFWDRVVNLFDIRTLFSNHE